MTTQDTTFRPLPRVLLGHIAIETATLVLADPTYLEMRNLDAEPDTSESRLLRFATRQDGIGWGAVITPTGDGDGSYAVYLEECITSRGDIRPYRVTVEFYDG